MNNNNFNSASTRSPSGYVSPGAWASPATSPVGPGRPPSLMDQQHSRPNVVRVVVNRDGGGYGMKVSGDNPVYVQSVKEGGPAEKAGLHAGDKILQVNGTNVVQSTHTDVVALIKAHAQVVLTVQQRSSPVRSPSTRPSSVPSSTRITAPRPVDNEKQYQLQQEKEQYYRLMIEKEQHHLDKLRSEVASSVNEKKLLELAKAEKNLRTLQDNLSRSLSEQHSPSESHCNRPNNMCTPVRGGSFDEPPPLPKRNKHSDINSLFLTNEINANSPKRETASGDVPPPLPPRTYPPHNTHTGDASAANSIDKQMSYPLVATCTPLRNDGSANNAKHQRTKSSPDCLVGPADGGGAEPRRPGTPPGTPPPPYPSPTPSRKYRMGDSFDGSFDLMSHSASESFLDNDRLTPHNSQPIRAANSRVAQQTIISMEDDDISDQEMDQAEDHGYFKSLSRLWEHLPHLAVFMNYILSSNSDPNSLLFYLLTDLYKEGNAKEMRKWAFEIHSCFLVPGAPLRLNNVDENIAREIDDDLTKVYEKEEIMRKIFWKARQRAKEELTRQLADLQQKRTAGLGSMYGPTDQELMDHYNDKAKEAKLYESLFVPKVGIYLEEMEKDSCDPQKYYLAASLITILTRVFKILKGPQNQDLDRIPTFVNKDRSFKARLGVKFSRKLSHLNHQFSAQQYFTVTLCSYCHQIIYGISPQGYHCTVCSINLHRNCVKLYEDYCPGPFKGKEGRIKRLIGMRHENSDQNRQKKVSQFIQNEREKRQQEEKENLTEASENADSKVSLHPVSRTGSDRRPDAVREESARTTDETGANQPSDGGLEHSESAADKKETVMPQESPANLHSSGAKRRAAGHINRSESVKEQSEKQIRKQQRRNVSDPSHSVNANYDADNEPHTDLSKNTDSGSSSNSSISAVNGRLSESPSNSMDVHQATVRSNSTSDSDLEGETDPLNWQELVTEEELKKLNPNEKKRQEVINELFLTEASHVRMLKVLYKNFFKSLQASQLLKPEELNLIFPNIKELLDIHTKFNNEIRQRRKDDPLVRQIGDMLLSAFSGPQGEILQKAAATFCQRQQLALEFIKKRRERDNKFDSLLTECEKKRSCRRLQLQGIVPYEMQRLTRYPLLLERLIKSVEAAEKTCSDYTDELVKLRQAHQCSKEILGFVDEAAKLAHNKHRLEEIQRHLDVSNFRSSDHQIVNDFKSIDLTRYKLILEGGLQLRRNNKAPVQVHVLLMEEIVVILQKESEKFILKFFQTGTPSQPPLSPIIKMNTLLVRENAVCKNALFLVNMSTNNSQMYDLCAEDEVKRETWLKHFSEASEAYSRREGKPSRIPAAPMVLPQLEPDSEAETTRESSVDSTTTVSLKQEENQPSAEPETAPTEENHRVNVEDPGAGGDQTPEATSGGGIHITSKVSAEEWPLIQPSQVNVQVPPVHVAESILTPLEQIRRKDALVKQTLAEKENLVADLLSIPREHFEHIADMASMTVEQETETQSDIVDRLLSSVFQVDMLQKAVNDALNVSESDVIAAKGSKGPVCPGQEPSSPTTNRSVIPSVPATLVGEIAACLSKQLTTLLSEIRQVEEDRDRLRKELHSVREKLHAENGLHSPVPFEESGVSDESAPEVFCEAISDEPI